MPVHRHILTLIIGGLCFLSPGCLQDGLERELSDPNSPFTQSVAKAVSRAFIERQYRQFGLAPDDWLIIVGPDHTVDPPRYCIEVINGLDDLYEQIEAWDPAEGDTNPSSNSYTAFEAARSIEKTCGANISPPHRQTIILLQPNDPLLDLIVLPDDSARIETLNDPFITTKK